MGCSFGLSGGVRPEAEAVLVSGIEIDGRGRPVQATKIAMSTSIVPIASVRPTSIRPDRPRPPPGSRPDRPSRPPGGFDRRSRPAGSGRLGVGGRSFGAAADVCESRSCVTNATAGTTIGDFDNDGDLDIAALQDALGVIAPTHGLGATGCSAIVQKQGSPGQAPGLLTDQPCQPKTREWPPQAGEHAKIDSSKNIFLLCGF